jgi:hypothetical protein
MNLIKIIFLFIASISIYEVFLQNSPFANGITPMVYDAQIGMWHKRNFSNYIIKDCFKNQYFFDELGRVKNNYKYDLDKRDIVIIGDSQIEALGVDNKSVIHNSLFEEIDGKFNVLNYGLAGTGPSQQLIILKNKVELKNIDTLVQLVFLENDLNDGDPNNLEGVNRPKVYLEFEDYSNYKIIMPKSYDFKERLRDFIGKFEVYVYLKKTFYYYKNLFSNNEVTSGATESIKQPFIPNVTHKWKQLEGAIYQTKQLAERNNFNYIVLFYSTFEKQGFSDFRIQFERFLNENNINNLNILPFLVSLEKKQPLGFSCDPHWNKSTHQSLAKYLSSNIIFSE